MWKRFKNLKKANTRRKLLYTLIISYIGILLIPFLIGLFLFDKLEGVVERNAHQIHMAMIEQISSTVDSRTKDIDQYVMYFARHPKLEFLVQQQLSGKNDDLYELIMFRNELLRYQAINGFIDDMFIYFAQSQVILTPTLKTDKHTFMNEIKHYTRFPAIDAYDFKSYYRAQSESNQDLIVYVQSLPLGETGDVKASLVVELDDVQFRALFDRYSVYGDFFVFNREGNVIFSSDGRQTDAVSVEAQVADRKDVIITRHSSASSGLGYMFVVPRKQVLSTVIQIKQWGLLSAVIALAAGIAGIWYLSFINYRPIRNLVRDIFKDRQVNDFDNEIDLFRRTLQLSVQETKDLKHKLHANMPMIKNDFLNRWIQGFAGIKENPDEMINLWGIHLNSDRFGVVLIDIDAGSRFIKINSEQEWALMRFIIGNVVQDRFAAIGHAAELGKERIGILLNPHPTQTKADLLDKLAKLREDVEGVFRIKVTVAISQVKSGREEIGERFREAIAAVEYRLVGGEGKIFDYEGIEDWYRPLYYFPLETEMQLINYVKAAERSNVEKLLDQIYQMNFVNNTKITPQMGKCLCVELLSTAFKIADIDKLRPVIEGDPFSRILNTTDIADVIGYLKGLYGELCSQFEQYPAEQQKQLLENIKAYIRDNMASNMMNASQVAEAFDIHLSSLSILFKQHHGINISDYITQLRVDHAKHLLASTELSISEISERIGYANSAGFIRVFKKYEGVTPGVYRKINETDNPIKKR